MIRFFAKRRFNYIDTTSFGSTAALVMHGFYWTALGVFFVALLVSVAFEMNAKAMGQDD